MKNRFYFLLLIIIVAGLILFTVGNVVAQNVSLNPVPDLSLSYLINGMDLPKDQFEKVLKLTKDFLFYIQRTDAKVIKIFASQNNKVPIKPNAFTKTTVIQREFLLKMNQYDLNLTKVIGKDQSEKIFKKVYRTIPVYLLTQPNSTENSFNNNNGNKNYHPSNTTGLDPLTRQVVLQIETSNTMLTQVIQVLSGQPHSSTVQNQLLAIKKVLANQNALIQTLTGNSDSVSTGNERKNETQNNGPRNMK